mmetsp:Transcript_42379/g.111541  ORF Transcript_42379/g.111541 Transcript_42379/m.111541 type:complete len:319 (+) Transcript_42379:3640-4596(+)
MAYALRGRATVHTASRVTIARGLRLPSSWRPGRRARRMAGARLPTRAPCTKVSRWLPSVTASGCASAQGCARATACACAACACALRGSRGRTVPTTTRAIRPTARATVCASPARAPAPRATPARAAPSRWGRPSLWQQPPTCPSAPSPPSMAAHRTARATVSACGTFTASLTASVRRDGTASRVPSLRDAPTTALATASARTARACARRDRRGTTAAVWSAARASFLPARMTARALACAVMAAFASACRGFQGPTVLGPTRALSTARAAACASPSQGVARRASARRGGADSPATSPSPICPSEASRPVRPTARGTASA